MSIYHGIPTMMAVIRKWKKYLNKYHEEGCVKKTKPQLLKKIIYIFR